MLLVEERSHPLAHIFGNELIRAPDRRVDVVELCLSCNVDMLAQRVEMLANGQLGLDGHLVDFVSCVVKTELE